MDEGYTIAYGLDRSAGRLVLVRATRRGVPQVMLSAPPDSAEARRAWESVSREVEAGAAALAVGAPAVHTVVRRLRAPFASLSKAVRVWPSLLDLELPFPVEGAACAFGPPRREGGSAATTAAAIRSSDLAAFDEASHADGIDPTHVDSEALALWDQLATEAPPVRAEQPRALAWVGTDHVTVVRGRGPEFMVAHVVRAAPMGETPADRQAFEMLWASRMGQILSTHLAETGAADMDLWWAGPGADDPALAAALRRALPAGLAVRHETVRQPASFLARALARRAAEGVGVNFKTGAAAHPALVRVNARRLRAAQAGVVAAAVLVLALNLAESVLRRHRDARLQQDLTAAADAMTGGPVPRGQERLMVERALERRDQEEQPFRTSLDPEGLEHRLARIVTEAAAFDIEISRLSLSPLALSVEGSAANIQSVEDLAHQLRQHGWSVQSDTPGRTPEGRSRFILKGARHHDG